MSSRRPTSSRSDALPDDRLPNDSSSNEALTPGERSLLAALRQPGRKTIRAETTDAGVRGMEVEEVFRLDQFADRAPLGDGDRLGDGALALVRRLLAEAPFQDITLSQADGRLVSLRRILRSRFPR